MNRLAMLRRDIDRLAAVYFDGRNRGSLEVTSSYVDDPERCEYRASHSFGSAGIGEHAEGVGPTEERALLALIGDLRGMIAARIERERAALNEVCT